jgi:hypothetical protein
MLKIKDILLYKNRFLQGFNVDQTQTRPLMIILAFFITLLAYDGM